MTTEIIIFTIAAFFGAIAIVFAHASITASTFKESRELVFGLLEEMVKILPEEYQKKAKKALGAFGGFTILIFLSIAFNFVGKYAAPILSSGFSYFGDEQAQLWCEKKTEIFKIEDKLRQDRELKNPRDWREFQDNLGRPPVRIIRTLIPFSILPLIAGFIDLKNSGHRKRGATLIVASILLFIALNAAWAFLQGDYVRNLNAYLKEPIEEIIREMESLHNKSIS